MSTYQNAHQILSEVRQGLGEYSESFLTAPQTLLKFKNLQLLNEINRAQDFLYGLIARRRPDMFTKAETLNGVDSVYTLPWDYAKLELFRDSNGYKINPIGEDERAPTGSSGSRYCYYRRGNTLVLDKSGITADCELIYTSKPRRIHCGIASAGAAKSITLSTDFAPKIADYFNSMLIENVTGDWVDTITDYSEARVATIAETGAKGNIYGLVSELPDWSHELIAPRAILHFKATNPLVKSRPTREEVEDFKELLITTLRMYLPKDGAETDWADMFTSFGPSTLAAGGFILTE